MALLCFPCFVFGGGLVPSKENEPGMLGSILPSSLYVPLKPGSLLSGVGFFEI